MPDVGHVKELIVLESGVKPHLDRHVTQRATIDRSDRAAIATRQGGPWAALARAFPCSLDCANGPRPSVRYVWIFIWTRVRADIETDAARCYPATERLSKWRLTRTSEMGGDGPRRRCFPSVDAVQLCF